jgi:hypothetical protein
MICQVRRSRRNSIIPWEVLFGNRGARTWQPQSVSVYSSDEGLLLIASSLHALIENPPLFARASKGRLTLALGQVAVTIFNLALGGVAQSRGLLTDWGLLTNRRLLNDWWLDDWGRLGDWALLGGASRRQ